MSQSTFTPDEREAIEKYFGKPPEALSPEEFREIHRQLRAKYHPDNFEKFADETVREMATERFQLIERIAGKLGALFEGGPAMPAPARTDAPARFGFDDMKIEINTTDKDLKYHLFGARYRWLVYGDRFKIPGTGGSIIIDEDHRGHSIGYRETIRLYLTFGPADNLDAIVDWLHERLQGRASSLLIEGQVVPVDRDAMGAYIKRVSLLPAGD